MTNVYNHTNPQEAYSCFYSKLYDKYNKSFPLISQNENDLKPVTTPWNQEAF